MNRYTEPKYRTINDAKENELDQLQAKSTSSTWKPAYHIHPGYGLMNDPNGLAYFNGEFHVFYQWYPFGPTHGMKHWAHVKSTDLIDWKRLPTAIVPVEDYESHGAYSGASIEVDGELYLYYTGNIKYSAEERSANQCLAIMDKDGAIRKYEQNPIIEGVPEGYTGHVRDPKVFKKNDTYYMLLGAQRSNLTGAIIVYESSNARDWSFKGELDLDLNLPDTCYMLECPDYFELNGQDVLVVSPQGLEPEEHAYQNLYNVIYVLGELDIENLTFKVESHHELDKGFDFYAPQTFEGKNKERLLFGWAGMGEMDYPSDKEGWAHCLTIPRKLDIVDGRLIQKPARELEKLRAEPAKGEFSLSQGSTEIGAASYQYELELSLESIESEIFGLRLFSSETEGLVLEFNRSEQTVTLNRENFAETFGGEYGFERSSKLEIGDKVDMQIFVDRSIVEIFINGGELVFTSRVFPHKESTGINVVADGKMNVNYKSYPMSCRNSL
ncbi:glycoside hydrolase family 32 protein [Rossellomorea oryzaecorticis]|uniref:Sucrose-6-phosphate hydrolase n=1 Tax=Rossellomorea oryzaecorticis TaxID=1396505 RepID=A0ABW8VXD0_9BACI